MVAVRERSAFPVVLLKGKGLLVPVYTSGSNCCFRKNQPLGDITGKW